MALSKTRDQLSEGCNVEEFHDLFLNFKNRVNDDARTCHNDNELSIVRA